MDITLKKVEAAAALTEAIINLDVWRVFGANHSPSEFVDKMYLTINLQSLLHEMFWMYSTPSRYGFKNRLTINWKLTIEVEAMDGNVNVLKAMHEAWSLLTHANLKMQLVSWEMGTCPEIVFDNQVSIKNCCGFLWCTCLDPTINWKVNGILLLILSRLKVLNGLFEMAFDFQSTDATTNWIVEEGLLPKDKALLFKTNATTNWNVGVDLSRLIWFFEVTSSDTNDATVLHETLVVIVTVSRTNNLKTLHEAFVDEETGSHANNAKTLHKTFLDEVTDSNPVWEWTKQFNPDFILDWKVAKETWADIKRLRCFGPCQLDGWVFDESVILLWISLSCSWLLNIPHADFISWHSPPFDERLFGSTASKSIHLVGSESVCDMVHLFDCSLVAAIETHDWPGLDFQLPSWDLWMHLNDLPKERVPIAPRTSKEPALQSILSCSLL